MSNVDLYVQVDGEAENPEMAIADAAIEETSVPFEEGQLVEVKIEAAWKDLDGKYHARVSLVRKLSPEEGREIEPAEKPVKVAHDKITKPKNDNDSAMQNEPHMKMAEEDFEHDFDKAAEEKREKEELSLEIANSYERQKKADPNQPKPDAEGEL